MEWASCLSTGLQRSTQGLSWRKNLKINSYISRICGDVLQLPATRNYTFFLFDLWNFIRSGPVKIEVHSSQCKVNSQGQLTSCLFIKCMKTKNNLTTRFVSLFLFHLEMLQSLNRNVFSVSEPEWMYNCHVYNLFLIWSMIWSPDRPLLSQQNILRLSTVLFFTSCLV